jgi:vacuolar-type H+-ATPase subunit E/Vma4
MTEGVDPKKIEEELLAKKKAAEEKARSEAEKLIKEAELKGKEAAMKDFEESQRRQKQEEEFAALKAKAESLEAALQKQIEESNKRFQEELDALKSERKGLSRNQSPFAATPVEGPDLRDPVVMKEINQLSAEAAAKEWGIPVSAWRQE